MIMCCEYTRLFLTDKKYFYNKTCEGNTKMKKIAMVLILVMFSFNIYAADDRSEDRQQLRAIMTEVEKALNDQDFNIALKYMHQNVLVTYYNAEVTSGHDAALDFYSRMITSSNAIVKEYSSKAEVDAPATFYGNTAIAYGKSIEKYKLAGGLEFDLLGRWTATILKENNQWKIIALHFSTNLFENALLDNANQMKWIVGAIMFVVGVAFMLLLGRLRK